MPPSPERARHPAAGTISTGRQRGRQDSGGDRGGRGLGFASCGRLAALGADVAGVDLKDDTERLTMLAGGGRRGSLECDTTDPQAVESVRDAVLDRFGRCDVLVGLLDPSLGYLTAASSQPTRPPRRPRH